MINKDNPYISQTMAVIRKRNIIPEFGNFKITNNLLNQYIEIYGKISNSSNNKFDYTYARKLAGLTFLKFKIQNGIKYNECDEGICYIISNDAYKEYAKIGITVDLDKRLNSYQTYSPFRDFKVKRYEFVLNRLSTEKDVLKKFQLDFYHGEWISMQNANNAMDYIKSLTL